MKTYVFDPTAADPLSKVRGVGRYLQILQENFSKEFIFTDSLRSLSFDSTLINPFLNFTQPPAIKKRLAKNQIAVIHDLITLKYKEHFPLGVRGTLNVLSNKLTLKNYDLIVTDSETSKKDLVEMLGINEEKVRVIYPVLPKLFQKYEKKAKGTYCIYVGDATWNKNLINIAKAIKEANVTCVFIGKVFENLTGDPTLSHPWQKELKEFLELTKDDRRFIFPGFVSDKQLLEYYRQARVNLLLSRDEGFGFSYLEAASQSTGSLLSNIPVFSEIAKGSAVFADPENVNEIANKLIEIYFSTQKQKELGLKAKKRAQYFSAEQFKKALLRYTS